MTRDERAMIAAFAGIVMRQADAKCFVIADLLAESRREGGAPRITDGQAATLRTLVVRYRRELPSDIVALAGMLAAQLAPAVIA